VMPLSLRASTGSPRSLKDLQDIVHELKERRVALRATEQPIKRCPGANAVADPTSPSSAACRTGAGSTNKRRPGGIAVDVLPVGPTLWRQLGSG
jgi:hypothetical protein